MSRRRRRIIVTAGPTWEPLDPVRGLTNRSTGTMGYTVAAAARQRGHAVTLVTGPTALTPPRGVRVVPVTTAREMYAATLRAVRAADALVMTAAVADYRPATTQRAKLKRGHVARTIRLVPNPDILAAASRQFAGRKILVGFALETHDLARHARAKLRRKHIDLIVGNTVRRGRLTFGAQPLTDVLLLTPHGVLTRRPRASKRWVAAQIIAFVERQWCGTQVA